MTFPAGEPDLRLAELVAPGVMTPTLARVLGPEAGAVVDAEILEHKPGRRALLRYVTTGAGTVYGKAFPSPLHAQRTHDVMVQVGAVFAGGDPGLNAPRPLGIAPELSLLLYEPLDGCSLDALAGTSAMTDGLATTAQWLMRLHNAAFRLDRTLDLTHEAANAREWSAVVGSTVPELARPTSHLADVLAATVPPRAPTAVPIHKDFHYQHVVVGDALGVVDVDEARMGDALFDVGHFLTYLELLAHRTEASSIERRRWAETFAGTYGPVTDGARLRWYTAYTCIKIAKQLATGQGPRPRPVGPDGRQAAWAVHRGLAAVDR